MGVRESGRMRNAKKEVTMEDLASRHSELLNLPPVSSVAHYSAIFNYNTLGYRVIDTIRDGIFQLETYDVYAEYNASANVYDTVGNCSIGLNETIVVGFS